VSLLIQLFLTSNSSDCFLGIFLKIVCKSFINRSEELHTDLSFSEKISEANKVFLHYISCLTLFYDCAQQWFGFIHIVFMSTNDAMDEIFLILESTTCSSKVFKALLNH